MRHNYLMSAAPITLAVLLLSTPAPAQTTQSGPGSEVRPCDETLRSPRPTLRRRQPSDSPTSASIDLNQVEVKCRSVEEGSAEQVMALRFVGLKTLRESDVMSFFIDERVKLRRDRMPDKETVDKATAALMKLLSSKGHVYAIVSVFRDEELNSITFQIMEGERLSLADIQFEGLRVSSPEVLNAVTKQCLSQYRNSQTGYEQEALEYCLRHTANFVRNAGYLQAKFGEPKTEVTGPGIMVTVQVEEGRLYRLGKVEIEGSTQFSGAQIRAMLPLAQGEVATAYAISDWLFKDLRKLYGDLGYLQYTAESDPTYKTKSEAEGIVDFRIIIEEGMQYRLGSLKLEGQQLPAEELLKYSALRVGEIYSVSCFQDFVNKLNETELFEPIDKDGDSDFRTNEEEALVSITLKLRKRSQH